MVGVERLISRGLAPLSPYIGMLLSPYSGTQSTYIGMLSPSIGTLRPFIGTEALHGYYNLLVVSVEFEGFPPEVRFNL